MPPKQDEAPVNLLSLDGGGVRGVSELVILDRIMRAVQKRGQLRDLPKPCDYFDLIAGTSTGGLVAIMLGRLRMSTTEALSNYDGLAGSIFSGSNKSRLRIAERYGSLVLQKAVEGIVAKRGAGDTMLDVTAERKRGKAFVCAIPANSSQAEPHRFRSYQANDAHFPDIKIWEAARATTAAPTYFKPMPITRNNVTESYVDAAMGCNNPTEELIDEAGRVFRKDRRLGCLLSLGTGTRSAELKSPDEVGQLLSAWSAMNGVKNVATDCEATHRVVARRFQKIDNVYYRFSVPNGAKLVQLPEWQKMGLLKSMTEKYLDLPEITKQICAVADVLLRRTATGLTVGHISALDKQQIVVSNHQARSLAPVSRFFVGRSQLLRKLDGFFAKRDDCRPKREFLLYGMGGVGKTQTALMFLEQHRDRFKYVVWIDATDRLTLQESYRTSAIEIFPDDEDKRTMVHVHQCLGSIQDDWLIVMDNCSEDTANSVPRWDRGNVLYISRPDILKQMLDEDASAEVTQLDKEDAITLLLKVARKGHNNPYYRMDAAPIVRELGYLPLAIDQAGAHIYMRKRPLDDYLEGLRKHRQKLLGNPRYKGSVVGNPAVYTTFDLTYAALEAEALKEHGEAAQNALNILNVICFSRNERVMLDMFPRAAYYRDHLDRKTHFPLSDPDGSNSLEGLFELDEDEEWKIRPFDDGLILLVDYCLVKMDNTHSMCSLHVLISTWARDRMTQTDYRRNALFARSIMFDSLSYRKDKDEVLFRREMLPHIHHCLKHTDVAHKDDGLESEYADKFAFAAEEAGNWDDAASALFDATELRKWEYCRHGEPTLQARLRLAHLYVNAGRYGEAEMAALEVLERRQDLYRTDPHHRRIVNARRELIRVYMAQGRLESAMPHAELVLEARLAVYAQSDPQHRFIRSARQTLETLRKVSSYQGLELKDCRAVEQAVLDDLPEKEQGYAASVETHGRLHPLTIAVQKTLANLLFRALRFPEAETHFEFLRAHSAVERGQFHPATMVLLQSLVETIMLQGRWIEAEWLARMLWSLRMITLGPRHPQTLFTVMDLANCLCGQARMREALARTELAAEQLSIALGAEHMDTVSARGWVAFFKESLHGDTPANQRQLREKCQRLTTEHYNGNPPLSVHTGLPRIPEDGTQLDEAELAEYMVSCDLGILASCFVHRDNVPDLDPSILLTGGQTSLWRHYDNFLPRLARSPQFAITLRTYQK